MGRYRGVIIMDIKKATEQELKARAYDLMIISKKINNEFISIQKELAERNKKDK
jgi:hypothetical protein